MTTSTTTTSATTISTTRPLDTVPAGPSAAARTTMVTNIDDYLREHETGADRVTRTAHQGTPPEARRDGARARLVIGGVRVDHFDADAILARVGAALPTRTAGVTPLADPTGARRRPLAIGSVNLDHVYHFGVRGEPILRDPATTPDWQMLVDGSPISRRARTCTGADWPRLTGADLLPVLLDLAQRQGARVGFLGGFADTVPALRVALTTRWPDLSLVDIWTPPREVVEDDAHSEELAREIAAAGVDLLVVGLGKPRQERWIERHGVTTGAGVLTAFGAAADFLAGSARRAPAWMRSAGIEWSYRLAREPRRLSHRYLVQGPVAMWALYRGATTVAYEAGVSVPSATTPSAAAGHAAQHAAGHAAGHAAAHADLRSTCA